MNDEPGKLSVSVNGEPHLVELGLTVLQLLTRLKLDHRGTAVEINERLEPRENHEFRLLEDGDWLEVVTLVGGG